MNQQIVCPHPKELTDKFLRLGWGDWIPTPDVSDESKELYLTVDGQHMHVMSVEEALSLSDMELEQRLIDVMSEHRNEAIAEYERRREVNE